MFNIRAARTSDITAITEIYNYFILHSTATFDVEPKPLTEQINWFKQHGNEYPIMVALIEGLIIGWASLSKYSTRRAYASTAELSIYIQKEYQSKGYGKKLLEAIINAGKEARLHTILARIVVGNQISIQLHQKLGFSYVGTMKEVGRKFGELLDVLIMQLVYSTGENQRDSSKV